MDFQKQARNFLENLGHNSTALLAKGLSLIPGEIPSTVYLELRGDYPVFTPPSPLPLSIPIPGQKKTVTLEELRDQLEILGKVPAVKELIILERGFSGGFVAAFAIRAMLEQLIAAGKTITFYADAYDNLTIYLASACTNVVTLSEGQLMTIGLAGRVQFQAGTFKKIGIEVEYERRAEYKNAVNQLTETALTPAHRENISTVLGSLSQHWLETIASGRKLEPEVVKKAIDAAPLLSEEALEHGLLTRIAFEDELTLNAKPLSEALRFAPAPALRWADSSSVAIIAIEGGIADGESKNNPLPIPILGGQSAGGYSIARAIRSATQNENIKAIVLFVNSPGGSALASEIIWREVTRAKTVKPVVAVMGNVAASGGYYVACNASKIVAAPTTITGSIGVFNLHFNNAQLWEKLGFSTETIKFAEHSDYASSDRALSASERDNMNRAVQRVYDTFKTRVANGRNMTDIENLAKGRIWSGTQALEHGLVDELGTIFDGIRMAKTLAGLPADALEVHVTPPAQYIAPTDLKTISRMLETRIWALMPEQLEIR